MIDSTPFSDFSEQGESPLGDAQPDVPHTLEVLPDGREAVVIGQPEDFKELNHKQGDNDLGFKETCGLVSCEDVIRQFGSDVSETDVVDYAARNGLCQVTDDPESSGRTTVDGQARILEDFGVPAHAELGQTNEELDASIEEGRGVIAEVDAGTLWGDSQYSDIFGSPNHAIDVTGVARSPETGEVLGFYINDSGMPSSGRFVDVNTWNQAWNGSWFGGPGELVVTDAVHTTSTA